MVKQCSDQNQMMKIYMYTCIYMSIYGQNWGANCDCVAYIQYMYLYSQYGNGSISVWF